MKDIAAESERPAGVVSGTLSRPADVPAHTNMN